MQALNSETGAMPVVTLIIAVVSLASNVTLAVLWIITKRKNTGTYDKSTE
jgi:hypothetical protein